AHIAEALHDDAALFAGKAQFLAGFVAHDHHAAASGLASSSGSANVDGLAGYYRRHGLAHVHGIGIHHPGHDLFVGIDVGGGNVLLGANEFDQFGGVTTSHALDFTHRHFVRIADHTPLGAAKGNVDHGALPGHPAGEGAHFVEGDVRGVADAPLSGAACDGVLYAESRKNFEVAIIHLHRDVDRNLAVGVSQHAP